MKHKVFSIFTYASDHEKVWRTSSRASLKALDGGGKSQDQIPIRYEAGWTTESVWLL